MSDDLFDFSTENVQRKVNQATKSIDELYSRIEKLNKSSLNHLETELDKLQRAMPSMELQVSTKYALDEVRRLRDMLTSSADKGSKAFKKSWGDSFTALKANFENLVSAMKDGSLERSLNKIQFRQWSAQVAQATEEAKKLGYEFSGVASQVAKVNSATKQLSLERAKLQGTRLGIPTSQIEGEFKPYNASKIAESLVASAASSISSLSRLTGGFSEAATGSKKLSDSGQPLSKSFKQLVLDGNDVHSMARGLASGFNLLWLTWGNLAPLFSGAAISFGIKQTVTLGAAVEDSMTTIKVLSQETEQAVATLNAQMLDLATKGPYGPLEIAEAMKTLSLAGLSASQVGVAIKDVFNLAVAGTTSVQKAADVLTAVGAAYNIQAEGFSHIGDVVAKTAAVSKASVEDMVEAFKQSSVVNKLYGVSLQDVGVGIAALSALSIKGSAAGTALRNSYVDFAGRTPASKKALASLGQEFKDSSGRMLDLVTMIGRLDKGLSQFTEKAQRTKIQEIFTERGMKAPVELLDLFRTKTVSATGEVSNKLEELSKKVQDNAAFTAIAAAKMALTPMNEMKSVVATLQATLVKSFEGLQPTISNVSDSLKVALSSEGFKEGLSDLLTTVASLSAVLGTHLGVVLDVGKAYATWKLIQLGTASFSVIASGALTASSAVMSLSTGLQGMANANAASKIAVGMGAMGMATTATTGALVTASAVAKGFGLTLTRLAGFLPIVGQVVQVAAIAWMAYEFYVSGAEKTAKSVADSSSHKKLVDKLQEETSRIKENTEAIIANISVEELRLKKQTQAQSASSALDFAKNEAEAKSKLQQARSQVSITEVDTSSDAYKLAQKNLRLAENNLNAIRTQATIERDQINSSTAALVAAQEAQNRALDAQAQERRKVLSDMAGTKDAKAAAKPDKDFLKAVKLDNSNFIAELNKRFTDELSLEKAHADATKAILDAKHSAGIISAGKYAAEVFSVTSEFERKQLDTIESYSTQQQQAYEARGAEISEAIQKAIKLNPNKISEATAPLLAAFENLNQDYVTKTQAFSSKAAEVTTEANKRTALSLIKLEGEYIKTRKESEKFWREQGRETKAAESADALAQAFQFVNESIFSSDRARKAYAESEASESAKMVAHLEEQKAKLQEATEASEAFQQALAESMSYGIEDLKGMEDHLQALIKLQNQAKANLKLSETTGAETVRTRAIMAEQRAINESRRALANDLASAVETGIFEGAEEGSKALRKVLQDELLRKPLRVMLQAAMNSALGSLGIGGGTSGSGAGSGFSGFSSGSGMATGFATSNIGQNLGLSYLEVDSLGNFTTALSDTGQTLVNGLDTAGDVLGYATAVFSAAEGKWGQAAGQALGTWFGGPVGAAIGGKIGEMVDQAFAGETRSGGRYETTAGKVSFLEGPSGGRIDAYAEEALNKATFSSINSFLKNLGSKDFLTTLVSGVETSDKGKGGAFAGGTLSSGKTFGDTTSATGYQYKEDLSAEQALNRYAEEMNKVTIAALQSATDIPEYIAKTVAELDVEKLSGEQASAVVKDASDMFTAMKIANKYMRSFGDTLFSTSEESAGLLTKLTAAFGGLEQFNAALETFSALVSSPFELALASYTELTDAIDALGVALPFSAEGIKQVVNGLDLTTSAGRETYATMVQAGSAMLQSGEALLQSFGTGTEELAGILVDGLRNSDPAGAGKYFADTVVYGIENALYQNMGSQITQIVTNGIIAPLMNSMVMGETAAVAISKLSIASITSQVKEVTSFFSALFSNPEWISLMDSLNAGLAGLTSGALADMPAPRFSAPVNPWQDLDKTADTAKDAAEEAQKKWQEITDNLLGEGAQLSVDLLRAMGKEEQALAAERTTAIKGYDAYQVALYDTNQGIKSLIKGVEDLASAFSSATDSLYSEAQKESSAYVKELGTLAKYGFVGSKADALKYTNQDILSFISSVSAFTGMTGQARAEIINAATAIGVLNTKFRDTSKQTAEAFEAVFGSKQSKALRAIGESAALLSKFGSNYPKTRTELKSLLAQMDAVKIHALGLTESFADLAPAISNLEEAVYSVFGLTEDTVKDIFSKILIGETQGLAAGQTLGDAVFNGVKGVIAGAGAQAVSQAFLQHILNPIVTSMLAGNTLSEAMASTDVQKGIDIAKATASAYKALLSDSTVMQNLGQIASDFGTAISGSSDKTASSSVTLEQALLGADSALIKVTNSVSNLGSALSNTSATILPAISNADNITAPNAIIGATMLPEISYEGTLSKAEIARIAMENSGASPLEAIKIMRANQISPEQLAAAIGTTVETVLATLEPTLKEVTQTLSNNGTTNYLNALGDVVKTITEQPTATAAAAVAAKPNTYIPNRDLAAEEQKRNEGLQLQADLMRLQGNELEALAIEYNLATSAMQPLVKALFDANEEVKKQIAVLTERKGLESELFTALGDTVSLRKQELSAIDESNRGLKQLIWNLEDTKNATDKALEAVKGLADNLVADLEKSFETTDNAYSALERAIEAQKKAADTQVEQSTKLRDSLSSIFDLLKTQVTDLRGQVDQTKLMQAAEGRAVIAQSLASGKLPEQKTLEEAIAAARKGVEEQSYSSMFERDKAFVILSNELEALKLVAEPQLSDAEKALEVANLQLANTDELLKRYKDQIDVMRGVDISVLTVDQSISKLESAVQAEAIARSQISEIKLQVELAQKQYDSLRGLELGVTTMTQAVTDFQNAVLAEMRAIGSAKSASAGSTVSQDYGVSWLPPKVPSETYTLPSSTVVVPTPLPTLPTAPSVVAPAAPSPSVYESKAQARLDQYRQESGILSASDPRWNAYNSAFGLPAFADGGYYPGGMALVGEDGPEIINFRNPGQVYTAEQSQGMLSGDNAELVAEIRALREENKAQALALVKLQSQMLKFISRWDGDGIPETRATTA